MAIIYDDAVKAARMTATRDQFAGGTLEFLSANDQVLAVFAFTGTGGTIITDRWEMEFVATEVQGLTEAGEGTTATKARMKDSNGVARGTNMVIGIKGSEYEVRLSNTSISDGQEVEITTAKITHAANVEG